jgi:hypothetical protein
VDEHVVAPPQSLYRDAAFGEVSTAVNYPGLTTYTGLTQSQFTNVQSISYNPPSGSMFHTGDTPVTNVIHYKWGVVVTNTFSVRVYPGIAPSNIVRVSRDGQPVLVSYPVTAQLAAVVSNLSFSILSGTAFGVGETLVTVSGQNEEVGTIYRNFTVTIVDGSTWSSGGIPGDFLGDTDYDGQPDWLEMEAGTDPNNPADRFAVGLDAQPGNELRLGWNAVGGVKYQVERGALDGPWIPVGSLISAGENTATNVVVPAVGPVHFYRLKVVP